MHMKKEPLFIAFASQKGGVGKTAFTVLTAGILRYQRGYNVAWWIVTRPSTVSV